MFVACKNLIQNLNVKWFAHRNVYKDFILYSIIIKYTIKIL